MAGGPHSVAAMIKLVVIFFRMPVPTRLLLCLCSVLFLSGVRVGGGWALEAAEKPVALQPYLLRLAAKYPVRFAVEVAAGTEHPLLAVRVVPSGETWPEVVAALRRDVPGAEWIEIPGSLPVLMIHERSLLGQKTAMDATVEPLAFAGSPGELVEQLSKQVPNLSLRTTFAANGILIVDWTSQAKITRPAGTVRDALNALPRMHRAAILWHAEVALDGSASIAFGVSLKPAEPSKNP